MKKTEKIEFIEKPKYKFNVNTGFYVLNKRCLKFLKKKRYLDFNDFLKICIKNKRKINYFKIDQKDWIDIGQKENTKVILIKKYKLKNKIALIIGFGSIGRKHFSIIKKLNIFKKIYILTKQKKKLNIISSLKDLNFIKPSYIIISSRTNMHFSQLKILEKKNKKFLYFGRKTFCLKKKLLNVTQK